MFKVEKSNLDPTEKVRESRMSEMVRVAKSGVSKHRDKKSKYNCVSSFVPFIVIFIPVLTRTTARHSVNIHNETSISEFACKKLEKTLIIIIIIIIIIIMIINVCNCTRLFRVYLFLTVIIVIVVTLKILIIFLPYVTVVITLQQKTNVCSLIE